VWRLIHLIQIPIQVYVHEFCSVSDIVCVFMILVWTVVFYFFLLCYLFVLCLCAVWCLFMGLVAWIKWNEKNEWIYIYRGLLPLTEFYHVQNWLCVQVLRSPILAGLLHGTWAVGVSQTAAFSRGRHLYSARRPSRCASAHILVCYDISTISVITERGVATDACVLWLLCIGIGCNEIPASLSTTVESWLTLSAHAESMYTHARPLY